MDYFSHISPPFLNPQKRIPVKGIPTKGSFPGLYSLTHAIKEPEQIAIKTKNINNSLLWLVPAVNGKSGRFGRVLDVDMSERGRF